MTKTIKNLSIMNGIKIGDKVIIGGDLNKLFQSGEKGYKEFIQPFLSMEGQVLTTGLTRSLVKFPNAKAPIPLPYEFLKTIS